MSCCDSDVNMVLADNAAESILLLLVVGVYCFNNSGSTSKLHRYVQARDMLLGVLHMAFGRVSLQQSCSSAHIRCTVVPF